jgi:hypothetical protein
MKGYSLKGAIKNTVIGGGIVLAAVSIQLFLNQLFNNYMILGPDFQVMRRSDSLVSYTELTHFEFIALDRVRRFNALSNYEVEYYDGGLDGPYDGLTDRIERIPRMIPHEWIEAITNQEIPLILDRDHDYDQYQQEFITGDQILNETKERFGIIDIKEPEPTPMPIPFPTPMQV